MKSHKKYEDMKQTSTKSFWTNLKNYFREYTQVTGIHGIRYLTEPRSLSEKLFWIIILLTSLGGCTIMIYQIVDKYECSPVVVTFTGHGTPIFKIPFPAVTICPESKCAEDKFNYSKAYSKYIQHAGNTTIVEDFNELRIFNYVSILCNSFPNVVLDIFHKTTEVDNDFFDVIYELKPDEISDCNYMGEECLGSIVPVLTDQGICYSFNILDKKDVFKNHVSQYDNMQNVTTKPLLFNVDLGYPNVADIDTYPKRALMSGADNSLTLKFTHRVYTSDFLCNTEKQGFRVSTPFESYYQFYQRKLNFMQVLLHNPLDVPRLSKSYFDVPLDATVVVAIQPHLETTSGEVINFSPNVRNCYLQDERPLFYFKAYTQSNCLMECETNHTLRRCGCVSYYMPRTNNTKICGTGDQKCLTDALKELKIMELQSEISKQTGEYTCGCKPSCTSLTYNVETTMSDNFFKEYMKLFPDPHDDHVVDLDNNYFSILSIYFKEDQIIPIKRDELYGASDFIANFGGLLGLFTGFSILSCVEIIYFATLRIFYNLKLYGRWFGLTS